MPNDSDIFADIQWMQHQIEAQQARREASMEPEDDDDDDDDSCAEFTYDMPTGTGKSFLQLWEIHAHFPNERVLVVFPRLSLLSQFYRHYLQPRLPTNRPVLLVCTDQKDVKASTTEEQEGHLEGADAKKALRKSVDTPSLVVLTTYSSLPVVLDTVAAELDDDDDPPDAFDAIIFDEAHHRAAPCTQEILEKHADKIGAMINFSATPSDECGGERYVYPFYRAIADRVIRDFDLHLVLVDKATMKRSFPQNVARIGTLTGNTKCMAFTAYSEADKDHRTNVRDAVAAWKLELVAWNVQGITASVKPDERRAILDRFQKDTTPSAIISCRTLGEGIDVQGADNCVFIDPRSSHREIYQNIGRVLRLLRDPVTRQPLPHQPNALVLLPVPIDIKAYQALQTDEARDEFIRDQARSEETGSSFEIVMNVASALKEIDPEAREICLLYPGGPSDPTQIERMRDTRRRQGFEEVDVPADGNCFFHCLSKILEKPHQQIRREVVDRLAAMPASERVRWGLEDDRQIEALRRDGEWANNAMDLVPHVAADLYELDLRVHSDPSNFEAAPQQFGRSDGERVHLQLSDSHYTLLRRQFAPNADETTPEQSVQPQAEKPRRIRRIQVHRDPNCKVLWRISEPSIQRGFAVAEHRLVAGDETPEEKWYRRRNELEAHLEANGGKPPTPKQNKELAEWVSTQKKDYKNKADGVWKEGGPRRAAWEAMRERYSELKTDESKTNETPEQVWCRQREELEAHLEANGGKPPTPKQNKELSKWVKTQKQDYKNKADGVWKEGGSRRAAWEAMRERYPELKTNESKTDETPEQAWNRQREELEAHLEANGGKPPTQKSSKLGQWVSTQKQDYKDKADGVWKEGGPRRTAWEAMRERYSELKKMSKTKRKESDESSGQNGRNDGGSAVSSTEAVSLASSSSMDDEADGVDEADEAEDDSDEVDAGSVVSSVSCESEALSALTNESFESSCVLDIPTSANVDELREEVERLRRQLASYEQQHRRGEYLAPNEEMKDKINAMLADAMIDSNGLLVFLDHTDFRTATALGETRRDRMVIPQRDRSVYEQMRRHAVFGRRVAHKDLLATIQNLPEDSVDLLYADLMGSLSEARPILEEVARRGILRTGAVLAVTISCRDGPTPSDYTNQFATELTSLMADLFPRRAVLTPRGCPLVYGEGVRMSTLVVRV